MKKAGVIIFIFVLVIISFYGCGFLGANYTLTIEKLGEGEIINPEGTGEHEFNTISARLSGNLNTNPTRIIVDIEVEPAEGYKFEEWRGPEGEYVEEVNGNYEIQIFDDSAIKAVFIEE